MQRWIDQMRVDHPTIEYLDAEASTLGTPDGDITTIIDVTEHLDVRQRAIAAHASQTSPFEGLPDDLKYAFLAAIHARRVEPSWVGGDLEANLFG
jgi:LmbE family N-acetylglucosaminyl deacetylase